MNRLSSSFSDEDLIFLIKILLPSDTDRRRMLNVLRDDEEILEGMLGDERLFKHLIEDPESIIRVSPYLFFTVLLKRVRLDLERQPYTLEQSWQHKMVVFDSDQVVELLDKKLLRHYLADMLSSFVRINSVTIPIRVRKGIWRKLRFSDFDIDSLIQYSQMLDEEQRFQTYKRIADICLFTIGIFPHSIESQQRRFIEQQGRARLLSHLSREGFGNYGRHYYRAASQLGMARIQYLEEVLSFLADNFFLVAKPLTFMASHYLGAKPESFFLQ